MSITKKFDAVRREYKGESLNPDKAPKDPMKFFMGWLDDALEHKGIQEPNAMCLSTVNERGHPDSRIVLLKNVSLGGKDQQEGFIFFSNFQSVKGEQLVTKPRAALNFWWPPLYRQVRIEGRVQQVPDAESDEYFNTRNRGSQIGAWASSQSGELASYGELADKFAATEEKFSGSEIPRPPYWGGYIVMPRRIEFWEGRKNRLHCRVLYDRQEDKSWQQYILAP